MIGRLVLRHEILHTLTKPLLVTVATVSLLLNMLAFQMAKSDSTVLVEGGRMIGAQFAFLVPVIVILWMGRADHRCRPWETGLPLEAKPLWWAYLGALVLAVLAMVGATGLAFVGLGSLIGVSIGKSIFNLPELMNLVARPAAASVVAACLVAAWRPGSMRLDDAPGWSRYRALVVVVAVVLLGLLVRAPAPYALIPVVLAGLWAWRVATSLPLVLDTGGIRRENEQPTATVQEWAETGPSGRILRIMMLRTLFKWPISWLGLAPIAALFGMMMSGAGVLGMDEPYLRFTNFFMVVYILFAMSNHFMENLHKLDHLPIARRKLLRWLVIPMTLFFLVGYGAGRIVDELSPDRAERILFDNAPENYGLKVPPEVWGFSANEQVLSATAPSGETHPVMAVPVLRGMPWVLWKPFTTPMDASSEFVAWQISRAVSEVYDLDLAPEEIARRYLATAPDGRVIIRPEGLTIAADNPRAVPTGSGPVFPVWVGAELIALMIVNGVYFRAFKPGITIRKSRVLFWLLMGGLMALHIGGYVLFIKGWTQAWLVQGFWMGRIRDLGGLGLVGHALAWLGAIIGLAAAWRWAEQGLAKAEAPTT